MNALLEKGNSPAVDEEETIDSLGNGRFWLIQSKNGYRFSIDAILLAGFVKAEPHERVLEIGTGNGVALICLLARAGIGDAVGVEIQAQLAAFARRNILLNKMQGRARIVHQDAALYAQEASLKERFDVVFFNPPYRRLGSGRVNSDLERAIARHEIRGSLTSFLNVAQKMLTPKGKIFFIYPAARFAGAMDTLKRNKMAVKEMAFVHSRAAAPAELLLVCAIPFCREGALKVLAPIHIYEGAGRHYGAQMRQLFNDFCLFPASAVE